MLNVRTQQFEMESGLMNKLLLKYNLDR